MSTELNKLATELVGDDKSPNLFFVTISGDTVLVTSDFGAAHEYWYYLPRNVETTLEDRQHGLLAVTEYIGDKTRTVTRDDSGMWLTLFRIGETISI